MYYPCTKQYTDQQTRKYPVKPAYRPAKLGQKVYLERGKRNWEIDRFAKRKTVFSTNFGTVLFSKAKILVILMSSAYMELCLKSCPPSFSVLLFQFLNGTGEPWGWDLSVSTGERLQDSIMDEHILVLGGLQDEGEVNETAQHAQNMTVS